MNANKYKVTGIKAKDGYLIYLYTWENVKEPRGVVQIFHGMAEHAMRYGDFADYLNRQGYVVGASDHRGHGETAKGVEALGDIGEDGFDKIVEDGYEINKRIKKMYPDLPILLFGHSFGSFIAQAYFFQYGKSIEALILSGSAFMKGIPVKLGKGIASLQKNLYGGKKKSHLLDNLTFGRYNKRIDNPISKFSWLSRDEREVKKYEEDPLCGTIFPTVFYYYFFDGLLKLYQRKDVGEISKALPILLVSGEEDPVGAYGKLVKDLHKFYLDIGMEDTSIKLYEGARHELLHEINKEEVYKDILKWIEGKVSFKR